MKEIQIKDRKFDIVMYCYRKEIVVIVRKFISQEGNPVKGKTFVLKEGNSCHRKAIPVTRRKFRKNYSITAKKLLLQEGK